MPPIKYFPLPAPHQALCLCCFSQRLKRFPRFSLRHVKADFAINDGGEVCGQPKFILTFRTAQRFQYLKHVALLFKPFHDVNEDEPKFRLQIIKALIQR